MKIPQPADSNDGTVVNNGSDLTFTPGSNFQSLAPGESATTSFTYTTDTGKTEDVVVTVTGVNDAPVANDDIVVSTTEIKPVSINVVSNDTDVDGTVVEWDESIREGTSVGASQILGRIVNRQDPAVTCYVPDALVSEVFTVLDIIDYYDKHAEQHLADEKVPTPIILWPKKSKVFF